jgi:hypothetical protein
MHSRRVRTHSHRAGGCFPPPAAVSRLGTCFPSPRCYKKAMPLEASPIRTTSTMPGRPVPSSGADRRDGGEAGEQVANNGDSRGRRRQQGTSDLPRAGSYHNQTTGKPFSWAVAGDVMLSVVARLHAYQELRM